MEELFITQQKQQKWSPRGQPWPQGHILKSLSLALASKPASPLKCPVFGSRTALFFDWLKRKIAKQKTTYLPICQFVVSFPFEK